MAAAEHYTPERLMAFLRDVAMQGRVNPAVAKSRQSAIEQLFVELEPAERADIRRIDVDRLCQRLHKLQDSSIRPEVVMVYNKRVQAALEEITFAASEWPADLVAVPLREGRVVYVQNLPLDLMLLENMGEFDRLSC